jgi:hypothetical protein
MNTQNAVAILKNEFVVGGAPRDANRIDRLTRKSKKGDARNLAIGWEIRDLDTACTRLT